VLSRWCSTLVSPLDSRRCRQSESHAGTAGDLARCHIKRSTAGRPPVEGKVVRVGWRGARGRVRLVRRRQRLQNQPKHEHPGDAGVHSTAARSNAACHGAVLGSLACEHSSFRCLCALALVQASHRRHSPVVHPHVGRAVVNTAGALQAERVASDWRPVACIDQRRRQQCQGQMEQVTLPMPRANSDFCSRQGCGHSSACSSASSLGWL
jgi:hypothetical protein